MAEHHDIAGSPRGEPLRQGRRGIRVRVPLTGAPTERWARSLCAQLTLRLTGAQPGRDLALAHLVQGNDVVLEAVKDEVEARELGAVLREAVEAVNALSTRSERPAEPCNASQEDADRIALALASGMEAEAQPREPMPVRA